MDRDLFSGVTFALHRTLASCGWNETSERERERTARADSPGKKARIDRTMCLVAKEQVRPETVNSRGADGYLREHNGTGL